MQMYGAGSGVIQTTTQATKAGSSGEASRIATLHIELWNERIDDVVWRYLSDYVAYSTCQFAYTW